MVFIHFCVDFVPHGLIWVFCDLQSSREISIWYNIVQYDTTICIHNWSNKYSV